MSEYLASRLSSLSVYAILVKLCVEIMTVYRMNFFCVSFNVRVRYFNVSICFCKTGYSYIILKALHYTGNVRISQYKDVLDSLFGSTRL